VNVRTPGHEPPVRSARPAGAWATRICSPASAPERRIVLLIVAMIMMGLADLACSLTYMQSVGMIELNPLARHMASVGQTRQLVLFKLFTMALSCGALFLVRRHAIAEKAAWLCSAGLLALMIHWTIFNRDVASNTNELTLMAQGERKSPMWVKLDS